MQKNLQKNLEHIFQQDVRQSVQCKYIFEELEVANHKKKKLQHKWKLNISKINFNLFILEALHFKEELAVLQITKNQALQKNQIQELK